jgi:hypothetical protein
MSHVAEAAVLNPHPGLVSWWRFDEGTGSLAKDSSVYGNDGKIYDATWVDGKYGKALSFNGLDNSITVPNSATLNFGISTNFTISCWLKPGESGVAQYFLVKDYGSPGYWQFWISSANVLRFSSSDGHPSLAGTVNICDGQWHFVSVVCARNSKAQLYVDGLADGSAQNMAGGNVSSNAPVRLGSSNKPSLWFKGTIDEVRIFNRALSVAEAQESFQKTPDFSSKLLTKVPKGTTQVIVTLSWQGIGTINVTIQSPSKSYTEDTVPVYQKTVYSTSSGTASMLNIKRLSVSATALLANENWYVMFVFDDVEDYRITVEIQK